MLILRDDLVLSLLKLEVPVTYLSLQVLHFNFELVVDGLNLLDLSAVLVLHARQVGLKLFNQFLLVAQLLLHHFELLCRLLQVRVILGCYLQFDILFLKLLDLFVQVVKLSLVLLNLLFILGDPLFILGSQLEFVFFKLLYMLLPLVVPLALQEFDLGLELLDNVVFLLKLHVVEALRREVAALVAIDGRDQIL